MSDINEIRLSGTLERLTKVKTKTGVTMATFLLKVGKDRFKVACFKNVATAILKCGDSARISVTGSGSINSWKDNDDRWHNDFQVTAWGVEIQGNNIAYKKEQQPLPPDRKQTTSNRHDQQPYIGGPF